CYRRALGASHGGPPTTPRRGWGQQSPTYAPGHSAALRLLARFRRAPARLDSDGTRNSELCPLSSRRVQFRKRASPASSEIHVMGVVRDEGACKERSCSLTFIVRSFEASDLGSRSGWKRLAICPKSAAPALPS